VATLDRESQQITFSYSYFTTVVIFAPSLLLHGISSNGRGIIAQLAQQVIQAKPSGAVCY